MFRRDEMPLLQRAIEDEVVRRRLKSSGIGATVFGVISLFGGVMPPVSLLLIGLGALLSFCGLWNLVMVTPAGLLMSAISLMAVGLYNIGSVFLAAASGQHSSSAWPVLGVFQIIWGLQTIGIWRRFRHTLSGEVSDTLRARAHGMVDALRKANPKNENDVVVFNSTNGAAPTVVRLRLAPEGLLALAMGKDDVIFATPDQVTFEVKGESKFPRATKGVLRVAGRSWTGTTAPEGAERLRSWA
ncbi:MAG: hypothetical protein ACHQ52_08825, partial [Candidatus Eisenbacteria bacterium]